MAMTHPNPRKLSLSPIRACRGCGEMRRHHSGGLCRLCRRLPQLAARFPVRRYEAAHPSWRRPGPIAPEPTDALPGSDEKKRVMEERARRGFLVLHPLDARGDEE